MMQLKKGKVEEECIIHMIFLQIYLVEEYIEDRRDGTVELVCEGSAKAVDALCAWAERGPPAADVDYVERMDSTPVGLADGFVVRPTA